MELQDALSQISEIRQQMAKASVFRGYRSATVGFSAVLAMGAALMQPLVAPDPSRDIRTYLALWVGTAILSLTAIAIEMIVRGRRSNLAAQMTVLAVEQFVPSLVAGTLLTFVLVRFVPECTWMLPGAMPGLTSPQRSKWFAIALSCRPATRSCGAASTKPWSG